MDYVIKKDKNGKDITIRMVQERLLVLLKDFDELCKKNNIEYFLADGTCLGAVRHKGFIPWDDDLDVGMTRENYKKLLEVLPKKLPDKYTYHCYEKSKKYSVCIPAMKIVIKNTYVKEKNFWIPNRCDNYDGLFLDIVIYDHMSKSKILDFPLRFINTLLMPILILFDYLHLYLVPLKALYRFNAKLYGKIFKKSKYVGDEITWVYDLNKVKRFEYDTIFPVKRIDFEGYKLPVPRDYDKYLTIKFGSNYMTPVPESKRNGKHIKDINLNSGKKE